MARINRNLALDRIEAGAISGLIWLLQCLPFGLRCRAAGALTRQVISHVPALRRRITDNLDRVWPELDESQRRALIREVGTGFGLTLIEIFSAADFRREDRNFVISGAGLDALESARTAGIGAVLVSGHFGQWEAIRAALRARGIKVGAVYRPNNNRFYDTAFLRAIRQMGEPILPNTAAGTKAMIRHISHGGIIALLIDQHIRGTPLLSFFGQPARTATIAAGLALKFDLPLIPCYGIRRAGSPVIDVVLEAPIAHSDALTMTQQVNDSLEARVRANPGQWYWLHHRWLRLKKTI